MLRPIAITLLAATLASTGACHMQRSSRTALLVSGAAVTVSGYAIARSGVVDANHNGVNENPFDDDWGKYLLGTAVITGGLAMLLAGATAQVPPRDEAASAPLAVAPAPAPAGPPGATDDPIAATRLARPLPEVATSPTALRMAQQARSAVMRGNCGAAWATVAQIDKLDPSYGAALAGGPVMTGCPRLAYP